MRRHESNLSRDARTAKGPPRGDAVGPFPRRRGRTALAAEREVDELAERGRGSRREAALLACVDGEDDLARPVRAHVRLRRIARKIAAVSPGRDAARKG